MFEQINEPIDVVAVFSTKGGSASGGNRELKPFKFLWKGREFIVKKINLVYSSFEGRSKIYYFAVSDDSNYFKLRFDTESLHWTLLESYVD